MRHERIYRHVRRRLWERYRLPLDPSEWEALSKRARRGRAVDLTLATGSRGPEREVRRVRWAGRTIYAVYDKSQRVVITVLPPDEIGAEIRGVQGWALRNRRRNGRGRG